MPTGCSLIKELLLMAYDVAANLVQLAAEAAFDAGVKDATARSEWLFEGFESAA